MRQLGVFPGCGRVANTGVVVDSPVNRRDSPPGHWESQRAVWGLSAGISDALRLTARADAVGGGRVVTPGFAVLWGYSFADVSPRGASPVGARYLGAFRVPGQTPSCPETLRELLGVFPHPEGSLARSLPETPGTLQRESVKALARLSTCQPRSVVRGALLFATWGTSGCPERM